MEKNLLVDDDERKRAEAALNLLNTELEARVAERTKELREIRERLETILSIVPVVIYTADACDDYPLTFLSANVSAQLGYEPEAFLCDSAFWSSHIHPDDLERVSAEVGAVGPGATRTVEYRYLRQDGAYVWMRDTRVLTRDANGSPKAFVGYWMDITQRKAAAESLRESEALYRALFESSRDALMTLAPPSWAFTAGNPACLSMFGAKDQADFTSHGPWELSPEVQPDGQLSAHKAPKMIETAMREGYHFFEWTHRRLSGESFPATVQLTRVEIDGWVFLQALVRDITQHRSDELALKALAQELGRKNLEVQRANSAKAEFLAAVSHELRTPLNGVIGFADLLKEEAAGPLNAKQAEFATAILEDGKRLRALVDGILEFTRLEEAGAGLNREPVELGVLLEESLAANHGSAKARGVMTELEGASGLGSAELNPNALKRILDALLDNASKFNHPGGKVTVQARRDGEWFQVAVADTGIGIAREDLARLFKPLMQLDAGLARRYGGVGMGLLLAQRLAELQGGTLQVESKLKKGSIFTLRLPIRGKP